MSGQSPRTVVVGPMPPPWGGVAVFVQDLLALLGPDAVLWQLVDPGVDADPAAAATLPLRPPSFLRAVLAAGRGHRGFTILDSSHLLLEYPRLGFLLPWIVVVRARRQRWVKIVHDGTLPSRYDRFGWLQKLGTRLALRTVSEVVVMSPTLEQWVRQRCPGRSVVVASPVLVLPSRLRTGERSDDLIVCSVGAFTRNYNFDVVAEAVDEWRRTWRPDIRLVFVAGTYARDAELEHRVVRGREWVEVRRDLSRAETLALLQASDVVVRLTDDESYGISRVEALAVGTPVVATASGETRGVILVPRADAATLAAVLQRTLTDRPAVDAGAIASIASDVDRNRRLFSSLAGRRVA